MRESDLLDLIARTSATAVGGFPGVLVGPGDDCAVIAPGGSALLLKVDQLIEGRHFAPGTPLELVARKAIARAVSDIAAMAGTPFASLAAAVFPHAYPQADADRLCLLLHDAARRWGCPTVGGDVASFAPGDHPLTLSITVLGGVHPTRGAVLRSGVRPGDAIYVTGSIGGSFASGRHLTFEPRLAEGAALAATLGDDLHAMMDVSDGLGRDAGRLAAASRVRIELDTASIPLNADVLDTVRAASDGEDYELLFAVAADAAVPGVIASGTPCTRIGRAIAGSGCVLRLADGREIDAIGLGWDHA